MCRMHVLNLKNNNRSLGGFNIDYGPYIVIERW